MARRHWWFIGLMVFLGIVWVGWLHASLQALWRPGLPAGVKVHRNLAYIPGGHERNKLDLYLPEKADKPLPVVVWIHGGAWQAGSKENPPGLFLTGKGYAVASINYRLSQHAPFPAQLHDCKAALRWLRANAGTYHLDPDHIGVWGGSAGGHLVALLGTTADMKDLEGPGGNLEQSSRVQAVVDFFGPTDLRRIDPDNKLAQMVIGQLLGGPIAEKKDRAALASPVTHVGKDAAPFLILHGDKDDLVPISQSDDLEEALKKAGAEVTFKRLRGAGHGGPAFLNAENSKLIQDFLDKHLKGDRKK